MSKRQAVNVVLKSLILAIAIMSFSTCAFAEDTYGGKMDYEANCAACHGQNGKGDGPLSTELRTKPPDLTLIAQRNDGVFPADLLSQRKARACAIVLRSHFRTAVRLVVGPVQRGVRECLIDGEADSSCLLSAAARLFAGNAAMAASVGSYDCPCEKTA